MSGQPVVAAAGLRYRYGNGPWVLDGLDLRIEAGETVALLGPNASGKTTFLLHLNGILRGEGKLEVCGLPVEPKHLPAIRRKVGFLFQDPDDQLFLPTLEEDVMFGPLQAGMSEQAARDRALHVLDHVGLTAEASRPPYHLSAGQKQRAAFAGILATHPELLVLDEPTTHLDPPARRHLVEFLATLPQAKILVTHDSAFARALAPRSIFLERGQIAADGPTGEILERFGWEL